MVQGECDKAEGGPYEDNWVGKLYEGKINKGLFRWQMTRVMQIKD